MAEPELSESGLSESGLSGSGLAEAERHRTIVITGDGPVLVSGPVDVVTPDGERVRSTRPITALCVCRRSRHFPFCDASHRRRTREDQ